jgi:hypothetical protein
MSSKGPMRTIQIHQWQAPQTKNKNRAKENSSRGHSFSNALSTIAPARSRQLLDYSTGNDWAGGDVDYGWPDLRRPLPHQKKI